MDVAQYHATMDAVDASTPAGLWTTAPSLAATTVPMENTSGFPVTVDVSGGTVTVIAVNGVTTGITSGTVRLRRGDKLAITYSVAPTVTWYVEFPVAVSPSGAWAGAPSLAATTVPMTNTSGFAVSVHISAGTVTVIKIDGVTTGLTSGSFRIRRGGTLTITYSVAPTLAWTYL